MGYFYHSTPIKNIKNICRLGLRQSIGIEGKGVYLATSPEKTLGTSIGPNERNIGILRVNKESLFKKFGKFNSNKNPSGKVEGDFKNEVDGEIIVRTNIPQNFIEYKSKGNWVKCS